MIKITWQQLISPRLWFDFSPGPLLLDSLRLLILSSAAGIILGLIFKGLARTKRRDKIIALGWRKFSNLFFWLGFLGLIYSFFAYEGAQFLSSRFWLLIIFLIGLIWLGFILDYWLRKMPRQKKERAEKKKLEKYLP